MERIRKQIVVIDLDGTLCDDSHREHLVIAKEYDAYHALLRDDVPWPDVKAYLSLLGLDSVTVALTARPETYRAATHDWLIEHECVFDHVLMRGKDDFRNITEVKPELLRMFLQENDYSPEDVLVILEDREHMVEKWRNLGYRCWQVRPGGY